MPENMSTVCVERRSDFFPLKNQQQTSRLHNEETYKPQSGQVTDMESTKPSIVAMHKSKLQTYKARRSH